jgi:hypothetical protein
VDHYGHFIPEKSKGVCTIFVIDLVDILHFKKMVARTERTLLRPSPLISLAAYLIGIGAVDASP